MHFVALRGSFRVFSGLGAKHDSLWGGRAVGVAFDEGGQITRHGLGVLFQDRFGSEIRCALQRNRWRVECREVVDVDVNGWRAEDW
jgi:hypothetical protein